MIRGRTSRAPCARSFKSDGGVTYSNLCTAHGPHPPVQAVNRHVTAVGQAFAELLEQEFGASVGHLTTLLHGCVFAPSLLRFWLVNGVIDFSTAFAIGAIAGSGGLVVRLTAYLLHVPVFIGLRVGFFLAHPRHRRTVLSGACPSS